MIGPNGEEVDDDDDEHQMLDLDSLDNLTEE